MRHGQSLKSKMIIGPALPGPLRRKCGLAIQANVRAYIQTYTLASMRGDRQGLARVDAKRVCPANAQVELLVNHNKVAVSDASRHGPTGHSSAPTGVRWQGAGRPGLTPSMGWRSWLRRGLPLLRSGFVNDTEHSHPPTAVRDQHSW